MENEAQIRALDVCLINLQSGEKLEQVVDLYPQWSAKLTAPLEAAQVLQVYAESLPDPQSAQVLGRPSYLETAQRLCPPKSKPTFLRTRWSWLAWLALIFLLLAGALGGYAVISLSLPGERFYTFKEIAWRARLMAENNPVKKLELERTYDQVHLEEIKTLIELKRQTEITFVGLLQQTDPDTWRVGGLAVKVPPEAQLVGQVQEGEWVEVWGEMQTGGTILAKRIRPREYAFKGILQEISPEMLMVSGIPVKLTGETLVHGSPMAGSLVKVIAFRTADNSLLARLVDTSD